MSYFFLSFNILPYITPICKVNFVCKMTQDWYIFIINWLVDIVNRSKFYLFFTCKFVFYYLIPIKFFYDWTRQILCYFIFTLNFFFIKNLNLSLFSKTFKKKLYFPNTMFTRKHLPKYSNKILSSWMSSFISSNSS